MGEPRVMAAGDWCKMWENYKPKLHLDMKHPLLLRHLERFTQGKNEARILLPFCGKSVDIVWLSELGHLVTAVDVSIIAMQHLAKEHDIQFAEEPIPDWIGTKYKATNSNITFYVCNILDFCSKAVEDSFDAIWDKAGFSVINLDDRNTYVEGISPLLTPTGVFFLIVPEYYDRSKIRGPPHYITEVDVKGLFGSRFHVEFLDSMDGLTDLHKSWGLESFTEMLYHLTLKCVPST